MIFEGLANCLTSPRKTSEVQKKTKKTPHSCQVVYCNWIINTAFGRFEFQDLELCRNVIMILALAASSGNSGYELLSSHKLPQDTNFLMLILHLLAAEIDSESAESHPKAEIFKARYIQPGSFRTKKIQSNLTSFKHVFFLTGTGHC